MKKTLFCAAVVGALALTGGIENSYAQHNGGGGSHRGGSSMGGGHGGGGSAIGGLDGGGSAVGGHGGGGWRGGSTNWNRGNWGNWNRGSWNRGFRGRTSFGIVIGAPFAYWGAGYYPYYYNPYYYPAYGAYGALYADPVYADAPVYADPGVAQPDGHAESTAPAYTQRDPGYRYYCPDPAGYFPGVRSCAKGWLKVVPDPAAQYAPPANQPRQ